MTIKKGETKLKKIVSNLTRPAIFILALAIGVVITYGITTAGNKMKGPLTAMMDHLQSSIYKIEHKIIMDRRADKRIDRLKWFEQFREDRDKLANPDFILLGASDASTKNSYEKIISLEDTLNTTFPLIHIYSAWGSKPDNEFPLVAVNTIHDMGSVPLITWEPWVSDFDESVFKVAKDQDREYKSMQTVAYGVYDLYIKKWALKAKDYGHPIYLRFGHEMNDPVRYSWGPMNDNGPEEYIKAWQHVHDIFKWVGADNVIWVWSPHTSYGYYEYYYPGEKYVDVVATGVLNYGTVAPWSEWWSFREIFGNHYNELTRFNKPIMIAELGSLSMGGNRSKWFEEALHDLPQQYPALKWLVFFHYSADYTVTSRSVNWYFKNEPATTDVIREKLKSIQIYNKK